MQFVQAERVKWVPACARHQGTSATVAREPCWEVFRLGHKWAENQKEAESTPTGPQGDTQGTRQAFIQEAFGMNVYMREQCLHTHLPVSRRKMNV